MTALHAFLAVETGIPPSVWHLEDEGDVHAVMAELKFRSDRQAEAQRKADAERKAKQRK